MTQEIIENILTQKYENQVITISFLSSELEAFFNNLNDKEEIKSIMLKGLKYLKNITRCTRELNESFEI